MRECFYLGWLDLLKYKKAFILFLLMTFFSMMIVLSSLNTFVYEIFREYPDERLSYSHVPLKYVKTDDAYSSRYLREIATVLKKGGTTNVIPESLASELGVSVQVMIGDFVPNSSERVYWYILEDDFDYINRKNNLVEKISNDDIDKSMMENYLIGEGYILTRVVADYYQDLNNYQLDNGEMIYLIEQTSFNQKNQRENLNLEFQKIFENDDVSTIIMHKSSGEKNYEFMLRYMFLLYFLMISYNILASKIFYEFLTRKMTKEYRLHILFGARKNDILLRNSVFVVLIILCNAMFFSIMNQFRWNIIASLTVGISLLYIILQEIIIFFNYREIDLTDLNVRE